MSLESIRNRNKNGKLDRLLKAYSRTSLGKKNNNTQEDTYYPARDKNGNGSCIIRFLPGLESEDYPYYVERFQHGFKEKKGWFIEFCPTTIKKECPVCEEIFEIINEYGNWKDCPEHVKKELRRKGRNAGYNAGYYCNILVIKDPANPENEGKVHLFKFGKAIFNMIHDMAEPQKNLLEEDNEPVDIFDLAEGANFKFIIRDKDGRADYSKSSFEKPSPCPEFDEDSQIPLFPLIDKKLFKDYDELKKLYDKVKNKKIKYTSAEEAVENIETPSSLSKEESKEKDKKSTSKPIENAPVDNDDEDENMEYFKNLADEIDI